jgi:hypothetical protein
LLVRALVRLSRSFITDVDVGPARLRQLRGQHHHARHPGRDGGGARYTVLWGSLSVALAVAGFAAFPLNRWLLQRGKGHATVHQTGIHDGPSPEVVGTIAAVAATFGTTVLVAEALG